MRAIMQKRACPLHPQEIDALQDVVKEYGAKGYIYSA